MRLRVYVFKQVVKKWNIKIINDKYNKRLKNHRKYTTNVKINIKYINSNENYVKKTVALLKTQLIKFLNLNKSRILMHSRI